MVQSLNTRVDLTIKGTVFIGVSEYGEILIGDRAFEFYHHRDSRKYIQIPWHEVELVTASVLFGGRFIPRYAIKTKQSGTFHFASKDPKKVLKAIRCYIDGTQMVKAEGFFKRLKSVFIKRECKK
ncbi:DUF956 family protein [Orbaceae bacterium ESL0721]|nr:DUF956 family protein [Orbaceae bacterium ESL0721]